MRYYYKSSNKLEIMSKSPRIFSMSFSKVYPFYIEKAEKKNRTKGEVDEIIFWLTGYNKKTFQNQLNKEVDFKSFFDEAPKINPNVSLITGVVCGIRVEDIEDQTMRNIRYLDKLVDELAKGKEMKKILRK